MIGKFWAFVPAIIAIALALISKQVYLSLFIGIFFGGMFLAQGNPIHAFGKIFELLSNRLGKNGGILIFLVMLGILVVMLVKSGASTAYGKWANKKIKSREGALFVTAGLGGMIFVDDYFNCLTVGSVMRPVTDKFKVSRAKLAYIIDSTAAPICIIAPISSWAAAVTGELSGDGIVAFIKTIPFNLYAILTLIMVFFMIGTKLDFGRMHRNEINALRGDVYSGNYDLPCEESMGVGSSKKGKVVDLILPVVALILLCVGTMIYSGYFDGFEPKMENAKGVRFAEAFSRADSGTSLAVGSTIAVLFTAIYYQIRRVITFKETMNSITEGFKSMVPAILILILAWTISSIIGDEGLKANEYVKRSVGANSVVFSVMPAMFFLIASGISFATGTSWGTFGILIPIATAVLGNSSMDPKVVITISAILAGSVFGDHISPISDTTILSSSGAQCNHIDHVKTQMPYAGVVAAITLLSYIILGVVTGELSSKVANPKHLYGYASAISLTVGPILLIGILSIILLVKKHKKELPTQVVQFNKNIGEEDEEKNYNEA